MHALVVNLNLKPVPKGCWERTVVEHVGRHVDEDVVVWGGVLTGHSGL